MSRWANERHERHERPERHERQEQRWSDYCTLTQIFWLSSILMYKSNIVKLDVHEINKYWKNVYI